MLYLQSSNYQRKVKEMAQRKASLLKELYAKSHRHPKGAQAQSGWFHLGEQREMI